MKTKIEWTADDVIALVVICMLFVFVLLGYDHEIVFLFIAIAAGYFGLTAKRKYRVKVGRR